MAIDSESKLLKVLRLSAGTLLIIVGALAILAGLAGPEPIRIGAGTHQYYLLVANPPQYPMATGAIGVLLGVLLILLPVLRGKKGR